MDQSDAVEIALAKALGEAAVAGRFDVVAQLAKELEARRLAGSNVVRASRPLRTCLRGWRYLFHVRGLTD